MLILFAEASTLPIVTDSTFVLIPLKSFVQAKLRLATVMTEEGRVDLAKKMAEIVLDAAHPLPVAIVCDDSEVAAWAREKGAEVTIDIFLTNSLKLRPELNFAEPDVGKT